jgi:hypothetical protein
MKSRRCTASLTLVLIDAAALQGCAEEEKTAARDVYRNRADCQRDWGADAAKCEEVSSGPHAGYFYGPLLYGLAGRGFGAAPGSTMAPRPGSNAIATTQAPVNRGGFGSSARRHSAGGRAPCAFHPDLHLDHAVSGARAHPRRKRCGCG